MGLLARNLFHSSYFHNWKAETVSEEYYNMDCKQPGSRWHKFTSKYCNLRVKQKISGQETSLAFLSLPSLVGLYKMRKLYKKVPQRTVFLL